MVVLITNNYVLKKYTAVKLSIRMPPLMDPKKATKILTDKLTAKPLPFNANVEFDCVGHFISVINGGNITPRTAHATRPPFSSRSIASITDADGINPNDGNNSDNIINVDIDDVLYNNGFEIQNAKITGIKAVNSTCGIIDVIVKHASIKNKATNSNTNTNNGNGNGNINININIHESTSIIEIQNSCNGNNTKNVNGINFCANVSSTQTPLTDLDTPISINASIEINNNVSLGTSTQITYHTYPAVPSNSNTNTNTSTTKARKTTSVSNQTNTGININTSNKISFKKRSSLTQLRFSRTSSINEKNIRAKDHDGDQNNNNKDNKSKINSNSHDKMRGLAKNININDSSIDNNVETRKKRSSIRSDKGEFDLENEVENDSDISSDERNKRGILGQDLYSQLEREKKRQTIASGNDNNGNNSSNDDGIYNCGTASSQNIFQLKCFSKRMKDHLKQTTYTHIFTISNLCRY